MVFEKSVDLAKESDFTEADIRTNIDLLNDAAWQLRDEDVAAARAKNNEALKLLKMITYHRGMIQALAITAFLELRLAHYKESLELALSAEKLSNEQSNVEFLIIIYNAICICYEGLGVQGLAFQYIYKQLYLAQELYENENKSLNEALLTYYLGTSKQDLAFSYMQVGLIDQAIPMFKEARKLLSEIDDEWPKILASRNLAECYLQTNEFEKAQVLLAECQQFAEEKDHDTAKRFTYNSLAKLHEQKGEFQQALEYIDKGKTSIKSQMRNRTGHTVVKARLLLKLKKYEEAEALLQMGLSSEEFGLPDMTICYKLLSQCYSEQKLLEKSHEALLNYVATNEKLQQDIARKSMENNSQVQDLEKFRIEAQEAKYDNDVLEAKVNELSELQEKYYQLSIHDSLTGLPNRRYITEFLTTTFAAAKRYQGGFGLALIDLDHFKLVNDNYSHQTGDRVLKQVAEILKSYVRQSDAVARFGGEEFILTFQEDSIEHSVAFCERIRKAIESYDWEAIAEGLQVTASFGIASLSSFPYCNRFEDLISIADKKLYESKDKGRNCLSY